jgi:uncharacterized protein
LTDPLPSFRFHTDPPAEGVLQPTALACAACNQVRGVRVSSHYGVQHYDSICPWCVANGRAATALGVSFEQDIDGDVAPAIWNELNLRNPGYESWQGENWLTHCGKPCVFHGDLPRAEVLSLPAETEAAFLSVHDWIEDWPDLKATYAAGDAAAALYKFVCSDCGCCRIGIDFS